MEGKKKVLYTSFSNKKTNKQTNLFFLKKKEMSLKTERKTATKQQQQKHERFYTIEILNDGIVDSGIMKVRVTYHFTASDEVQINEYFEEITRMYAKNRRFLILYDASSIRLSPTLGNMVTRLMDFMHQKHEDTKRLALGCAILIPNPAVVAVIKTILMLKPVACPMQICHKLEAAQLFLQQHNPEYRQTTTTQ